MVYTKSACLAITAGATAVVGTDTAFVAAMANRGYLITTDTKAYAIASVTDATHLTLKTSYEGSTITAGNCSITYYADVANAQGSYGKDDTWAAGSGDVLGAAEWAWKINQKVICLP